MSMDGFDEGEFIMSSSGIGGLYDRRVYELEVPKGIKIPAGKPYITVHFGTPIALKTGRGFGPESSQPHLLAFQVHVHASTKDDLKAGVRAVIKKLVGLEPSTSHNAGEISLQGGLPLPRRDDAGTETRLTRILYFQVTIGLSSSV
ncbi:MAG: hypothetical protein K0S37_4091 [Microbacterium sp.]|jgi:hypothetical protein|nr:hypothetical protein [Microbacterium sp.]